MHAQLPRAKAILCALLLLWLGLGLWFALKAPFGSGTDESIKYVAFAAAKNRWATEEDFRRYGIEHFYYPPLYFLVFAPFWGDEPSFVEGYPAVELPDIDPNYLNLAGRRVVSAGYQSRVPPPLERLYRQAKLFSLGLGLRLPGCPGCHAAAALPRTLGMVGGGARHGAARLPPPVPLLPDAGQQRLPGERARRAGAGLFSSPRRSARRAGTTRGRGGGLACAAASASACSRSSRPPRCSRCSPGWRCFARRAAPGRASRGSGDRALLALARSPRSRSRAAGGGVASAVCR